MANFALLKASDPPVGTDDALSAAVYMLEELFSAPSTSRFMFASCDFLYANSSRSFSSNVGVLSRDRNLGFNIRGVGPEDADLEESTFFLAGVGPLSTRADPEYKVDAVNSLDNGVKWVLEFT